MLTNEQKKQIEKDAKDFIDFLKSHNGDVIFPKEACEQKVIAMPKVCKTLIDAEVAFANAMNSLEKRHTECKTIEEVQKLTKDILKLCK